LDDQGDPGMTEMKKEVHIKWKGGQATWEECRDIVREKVYFKYIKSRRKRKENVGPLLNEVSAIMRKDTEKAELLNAFFASVFTAKSSPPESLALGTREEIWRNEDSPLVEEEQVRYLLGKLDSHKSMSPNGYIHEF